MITRRESGELARNADDKRRLLAPGGVSFCSEPTGHPAPGFARREKTWFFPASAPALRAVAPGTSMCRGRKLMYQGHKLFC
jgi:hypothetical protein